MSDPLLSFLAGVVVSLAAIPLMAVALRLRAAWPPVYVFAAGIAMSGLAAVLAGKYWIDHFHAWPALAAAGAIGIANFFVFSAVYKSISLKMLLLLASRPGCEAEKGLLVDSIVRPAVAQRMGLLVEMGMATEAPDGTHSPTAKGRQTIARLQKLQRLFGISSSGLYRKSLAPR
jgi:hypothetical protein